MHSGHDCESTKKLCTKHDAYYCESCDAWLETKCTDPDCEFCYTRPERPSEVDNGGKRVYNIGI